MPAGRAEEGWSLDLTLTGYGRSGELDPVRPAELAVRENRAEYRRGAIVEWYVNDERGLEQGFTLLEPPPAGGAGGGCGPLELLLELSTDLAAEVVGEGRSLRFTDSGGRTVLHYADLAAWDATGRDLAAALRVDGAELRIQVDDERAVYPLTVDPICFVEQAKLLPSDGAAGDRFGLRVALDGDTALIGADRDDGVGDSGSAYVFVRGGTTWTQQAKLTASVPTQDAHFGISVSLAGDTALVGAELSGLGYVGEAFVFARGGTTWTEEAKLTASDGAAIDFFGVSVSVSGDTVLSGASNDEDNGFGSGSAYVFLDPPPPSVYCTAGLSASGCQASMSSTGVPSASASSGFSLVASNVEGAKVGLFFFATNGRQANPWGNGTSFQCVAPPVIRTGNILAGSGTAGLCDGTLSQDLNALWCPTCPKPQKNPGVCATVQAQLWYRDPQNTGNQTTSFSDAIEFTLDP